MPANHAETEAHANLSTVTHINVSVQLDIRVTIVQHVSTQYFRMHEKRTMRLMHVGDPCADNPCLNGASCIPNSIGGFTCQCPPGYSGQRCEDRKIIIRISRSIRS